MQFKLFSMQNYKACNVTGRGYIYVGMKLHTTIQVAAMTLSLEEDILIEPWVDGWVGGWVGITFNMSLQP